MLRSDTGKRDKIVYVLTKLELGGAQKHTLDLIKGLSRNKYDVYLISSDGLLAQDALKITHLNLTLVKSLQRDIHLLNDILAFFHIYRIFRKVRPDMVHTHSSKAGIIGRWAAWLAGVKVVIHTVHGFGFNDRQSYLKKRIFVLLEKITAKITDRLIVVSDDTLKRGLMAGIGKNGQNQHKYTVIKYGVPEDIFDNGSVDSLTKKDELGIERDVPVVGMVSCLKPQKSPHDFIRMASIVSKKIDNAKFVLVGDGVLRKDLLDLIEDMGLRGKVMLTGFRKDAIEIMSTFDVFVLTSLWEGLPIVFLEAMALGKPIVATDTGCSSELIKDNVNGYLVKRKDYVGLADKTLILLKDGELSKNMGLRGNIFFKENKFFTKEMLNRTTIVYDSLVNKKQEA